MFPNRNQQKYGIWIKFLPKKAKIKLKLFKSVILVFSVKKLKSILASSFYNNFILAQLILNIKKEIKCIKSIYPVAS